MTHVSVDLWSANLEVPLTSLADWMVRLETRLSTASQRGSQILALPEFACAQWLSFAPAELPPADQLAWLADIGLSALPMMQALSASYGVAVVPGTIPHRTLTADGVQAFKNRAWLLTPEGHAFHQDKLSLTPLEANGAAGITIAGDTINVMLWRGLRIAMPVCLDSEFTAVWSKLGELDLDLVIIPAKTDMITGYNRVFACARARAIELQTVVCVIGAVGEPLGHPATDTGVGGASVYLPCDVSVSLDGVFAALAPQSAAAMTDPVLHAPCIPVGACRIIRTGGAEAEVSPALWDAEHLQVQVLS